MFKKIIFSVLVVFIMVSATVCAEEDFSKFGYEVSKSYRTIDKKEKKEITRQGHGTAIGVDLSQYTLKGTKLDGKFYATTAAHVILEDEDEVVGKIELTIKIPNIGNVYFEVIAVDKQLDIAIIKTKFELPFITQIDTSSQIQKGLKIINVGCPERIAPTATEGIITDTNKESFIANVKGFYHGSSGGGFFRKDSGKLIGISTSGISDKDDPLGMKRGIGIFIPIKFIKMLID